MAFDTLRPNGGRLHLNLQQHPSSSLHDVSIQAGISRRQTDAPYLLTSFIVRDGAEQLRWDGEGAIGRTDELWRHGCMEAFVASPKQQYLELNLAPTRRWAAYAFTGRRTGMRDAAVRLERQDWLRRALAVPRFEMHALWKLPGDYEAIDWRIGVSAVLETAGGEQSYWALAHPPEGPPDFHDPACFIATLPPPARA